MFSRLKTASVQFFPLIIGVLLPASLYSQIASTPPGATDAGMGGGNVISGTVYNSSGQRVETRVRVRLSSMTRGDVSTMSDERGNFAFRGLISGDYLVTIDKEKDYEPFSQNVNIIQFRGSPPGTYNVNVRLYPKMSAETKPGVVNLELAKVPKPALDLYLKALEQAKADDRRAAIELLKLATVEYPEFMLAFNELGIQYLRLNELENADEALRTALKLQPNAFTPLMNRGIVLFAKKKYEEAEKELRNALKVKEGDASAHYFLGQSLANLGRFDEAEKELVASLKLDSEGMNEGRRVLAIIYSSRGDKKKAAEALEAYLKASPQAKDAEQLRSSIKQLKGNN